MVEVFPRGWTELSFSVPFPPTGSGPTRPVGLCWGSAPSLGILLRGGQRAPPPQGGARLRSPRLLTVRPPVCTYTAPTFTALYTAPEPPRPAGGLAVFTPGL